MYGVYSERSWYIRLLVLFSSRLSVLSSNRFLIVSVIFHFFVQRGFVQYVTSERNARAINSWQF